MSASKAVYRLYSRVVFFTVKHNAKPLAPVSSPFTELLPSAKRNPQISRSPLALCCVTSMMPLHSAIASSRLRSFLSVESQSWGLIPQGNSMPL